MQEIDRAFKTVLALKPDCFLDLIFGSHRKARLKGIADPQINIPELRADKVLLVEDEGKVYSVICEAMLQPELSALPTFALKAFGNQYVLKQPTLVVIVYLEKGDYASFPDSFENRVGDLSTRFACSKILMWEHEARILSGELKEFAPFLALFVKQPDPGLIEVQKNLLAQVSDPKLRADLTTTTIIVDIRAFGLQVVLVNFATELNMLKETSIVQGWLDESLQKGLQKGLQEGQRQGKLSLLQMILAQKLGVLSPALLGQLQGLNDEQLNRLGLAVLNINSQEELYAWLRNGASGDSDK